MSRISRMAQQAIAVPKRFVPASRKTLSLDAPRRHPSGASVFLEGNPVN
jgi:hypothetical protein